MTRNREEQRKYENDIFYEVWRSGGNPDQINDDRVNDSWWEGHSPEQAARRELKAQETKRILIEELQPEDFVPGSPDDYPQD